MLCMLTHGLLLLNDGAYWDDALFYTMYENWRVDELKNMALETGLPLNYLFWRLNFFIGVEYHRIFSFLMILVSANIFFRIAEYIFENKRDALLVTLLFVTCTSFRSTVLFSTMQYQFAMLLFLVACSITSSMGRMFDPGRFRSWVAIVLFFLSFNMASLIPLFYCWYFYMGHRRSGAWSIRSLLFTRWDSALLLLPVVYFLIKLIVFPTYGLYENYNKIVPSNIVNWETWRTFFKVLIFPGFLEHSMLSTTASMCVFPLFLALLFFFSKRLMTSDDRATTSINVGLVFAILILAVLPYVLVAQPPRLLGWESRHTAAASLVLPFFIYGVFSRYSEKLSFILLKPRAMSYALVCSLCFLGVISSLSSYISLEAVAIKNSAFVEFLKSNPDISKNYGSFEIVDKVGDFDDRFYFREEDHESFYGWAYLIKQAWGQERWFANNHDDKFEYYKSPRYGTEFIDPQLPRCSITLSRLPPYRKLGIISRYYWYKYFRSEALKNKFYKELITFDTTCKS